MPTADPLEILLQHDRWATRQILDACARLTPEQFHQPFEMGPGSLHNTTSHILGAMWTWTRTLAGESTITPTRIDQDGQRRTVAELIPLLDEYASNLVAEARRRPLDETVSRTLRNGRQYDGTRTAVLAHVVTHGMHHRAQCLNMLRHLGVTPLPPSSVTEWDLMGNSARG
jgi:uncharacterized damage-inducible protein DinB